MPTQELSKFNNVESFTSSLCNVQVKQRGCGRPLFDGKNENEVVAKLQYAFSIGAQVTEACNLAEISTSSFYRYCRKYPEFRETIELLQTTPTLIARMNIARAIQMGDLKISMWYLERKRPQEFSLRYSDRY